MAACCKVKMPHQRDLKASLALHKQNQTAAGRAAALHAAKVKHRQKLARDAAKAKAKATKKKIPPPPPRPHGGTGPNGTPKLPPAKPKRTGTHQVGISTQAKNPKLPCPCNK